MRAYITGFSTTQCLGRDSVLGIITLPVALSDALPQLGYEVRVGPPHEYDGEEVLLMGVMSPKSFTARHAWDCMHIWSKRDYDVIIPFYDDWRLGQYMSQLWGLRAESDNVPYDAAKHARLNHRTFTGPFNQAIVDEFVEWINYASYAFMWPRFDVGDRNQLTRLVKNEYCVPLDFDPSPLVKPYPGRPSVDKRRAWVLAALADMTDWKSEIALDWPIYDYGHRNSSMGRIPESELQGVMDESWGVLASRYVHAGSGWWRVRYLMSAWAGSIIVPPEEELGMMGPSYRATMEEVEQLDDDTLLALANDQADDLRTVTSTADVALRKLQRIIDACSEVNRDFA